jgi:phage N-6-adenine-methyltransferase
MSNTDEWSTPDDLFERLDAEYHFTLDVCASADNAKCERYFTRVDDALAQIWEGVCWMNPPYGRDLDRWVAKAYDSAQAGATVVCLVPARTDTAWWQRFVPLGEVSFLAGRVKFNGAGSAPFPSAVVVFRYGFRYQGGRNETRNETGCPT